jgi:hypothetical protein
MTKPISQETVYEILSLYNSGNSIKSIERILSVSQPTISKILKKNGIEVKKTNYNSINIDIGKLNEEYDSGMSTYELSKKYNCSQPSIARRIKNIRPESERNTRNSDSKNKISKSSKSLWNDDDYVRRQSDGFQKWSSSDLASKFYKENYSNSLGAWIRTNEAGEAISESVKEIWRNRSQEEIDDISKKIIDARNKIDSESLNKRFEHFVRRSKKIHGDKYDYSESNYINATQEIQISCPIHGKFWQKPYVHANGHECPRCSNSKLTTEEFVYRSKKMHGDKYDYSESNYINSNSHVYIICPIHGKFSQNPQKHLNGHGCCKCRDIVSRPHNELLKIVQEHFECSINDRKILNGVEIDIYIPDMKFGIEINGAYWHGCGIDNLTRHSSYKSLHRMKADLAEKSGISLYQFWDFEINNNISLIRSMILNKLGMSETIYARKCDIKKLTNNEAKDFFDRCHIQKHRYASHIYGLILNGDVQCALSMSTHTVYQWEIIRYACTLDKTVVGGFSRLLTHFKRENSPNSILTFADKRFSTGELYFKNGFKLIADTNPNYFYYRGSEIISRQRCQKHRLHKILGHKCDNNASETINMLRNGYRKVYDAGHKKMLWSS